MVDCQQQLLSFSFSPLELGWALLRSVRNVTAQSGNLEMPRINANFSVPRYIYFGYNNSSSERRDISDIGELVRGDRWGNDFFRTLPSGP